MDPATRSTPQARHPATAGSADDGVIHVFEAVITGVLVLTAVLFLTGLSAPSASQGGSAIDLARVASDTLDVLESRPADCYEGYTPQASECGTPPRFYPNRLHEIVDTAMRGDPGDKAEGWLREVLPPGTRYLLRLDNGIEPLTLLPEGAGPAASPRGAQAAETFLLVDWSAHLTALNPVAVRHGETIPSGNVGTCPDDFAPIGTINGPQGTWKAMWGVKPEVPPWAPYGIWDCGGASFRVVPPGGEEARYHLYAVQLVVWPGA